MDTEYLLITKESKKHTNVLFYGRLYPTDPWEGSRNGIFVVVHHTTSHYFYSEVIVTSMAVSLAFKCILSLSCPGCYIELGFRRPIWCVTVPCQIETFKWRSNEYEHELEKGVDVEDMCTNQLMATSSLGYIYPYFYLCMTTIIQDLGLFLVLDVVALDSYNCWLHEFDPELLLGNK